MCDMILDRNYLVLVAHTDTFSITGQEKHPLNLYLASLVQNINFDYITLRLCNDFFCYTTSFSLNEIYQDISMLCHFYLY